MFVRDYELMLVLDPNMDEAAVEAATNRLTTLVSGRGGEVRGIDAWGRRRLAYYIGPHRDGIYVLLRLGLNPPIGAEVERTVKLMESVLRYLLVRSEAPAAAPAAEAPTAATAPA
ncbi:MAG TPA: 30S ribosomal protein S6 [Chloroflexota bacterium]|nr:30S ribosomal protein S6 [Chloroflexota bacterium]